MPSKDFNDDISALSEEGGSGFFGPSRRARDGSRNGGPSPPPSQSSASVASAPRRSRRRLFGALKKWNSPDDVSVSDSLCSGVLRGDSGAWGSSGSVGSFSRSVGSLRTASASEAPPPAPLAGGVADFSLEGYHKKGSDYSQVSFGSSGLLAAPREEEEREEEDDVARREQRKERVREKLDRYKRDQRQLKQSCAALEQQLAATTAKLQEVDSNSSFKIDALEGALRETRGGLERVAEQSTLEATDQSACIKTLGKKLIRQAHIIKRQRDAVGQYKAQLGAMQGEMALQDAQDVHRAEEYCQLKEQCAGVTDQKLQMQRLLQENIEEMMDLKSDTERDAKCIMDLEFNLQQKEAMLNRLKTEAGEKAVRISTLEQELTEMTMEVEVVDEKLTASAAAAAETRRELADATTNLEERRRAQDAQIPRLPGRATSEGSVDTVHQEAVEDFEAALGAKDATIQALDDTVKEHEAAVQELTSRMVKMSSTYKQDSYLQRKEIAMLKRANAEYALKLRALEKAFKCVNAPASASMSGTTHGAPGAAGGGAAAGTSAHGRSLHAPRGPAGTREEKAAAVQARLGRAPYRFPVRRRESKIVVESNFFDDGSDGPPSSDGSPSEDGRKGEFPEEC